MQMGSEHFMGPILEAAGDHLTVLNPDNDSKVTVKLAADARVIKDQNPGAKLSDFSVGDYAMVAGDPKDGALEAKFLVSSSEQSKRLREELGKTLVIGKVTSIDLDGATLKVHRVDGKDQIIRADESSSFKRGGRTPESITMADIKAGESISARGSLKDNAFTISELTLMPRGGMMMGGPRGPRHPEQNQH
jgi:hypothetical protein